MTVVPFRKFLTVSKPVKSLVKGQKSWAGRNNAGRISMRHQGGGHKQKYRSIDFTYDKHDIPAKIETIEYDPFRSGFIASVCYKDGERRYVLAPKGQKVGDQILVSEKAPVAMGNRLPLGKIPVGTFVFNIEIQPGRGSAMVRSAGNYAEVVAHDAGYAQIKLPSSEIRKIIETAWATIGEVSNDMHRLTNLGKAGRSRWKGIRPTVRGSAMNPVDHPHGGGEGRQGRGLRRAKSLWGRPTGKGQKTRRSKKYSNKFIVSRRHVGSKRATPSG